MVQAGRAHAERGLFVRFALRRAVRGVAGFVLAIAAIIVSGEGSLRNALTAGLLAALALYACLTAVPRSRAPAVWTLIFDAAVVAGYVLLCNPALALWRAAGGWGELFSMSPVGAGAAVGLYICIIAVIGLSSARPALCSGRDRHRRDSVRLLHLHGLGV